MIMKTHDADRIRRKAEVSQNDRTTARDNAARFVEEGIIETERWPEMSLTDIAELSAESDLKYTGDGWSRQHISNTIEAYFEPVFGDDNNAAAGIAESESQIPVPEDLDDDKIGAYVRGYLRAKKRHQ